MITSFLGIISNYLLIITIDKNTKLFLPRPLIQVRVGHLLLLVVVINSLHLVNKFVLVYQTGNQVSYSASIHFISMTMARCLVVLIN